MTHAGMGSTALWLMLLLGALVRRLGNWAGGILCAAAVAGWLAIDLGLYLFGSCPRCP